MYCCEVDDYLLGALHLVGPALDGDTLPIALRVFDAGTFAASDPLPDTLLALSKEGRARGGFVEMRWPDPATDDLATTIEDHDGHHGAT